MARLLGSSQGTLAVASLEEAADNIFTGLDVVEEKVNELHCLDDSSKAHASSRKDSVPNRSRYRFTTDGIIRRTIAARTAYEDIRSSIERLLDTEGLLAGLSPLHRHRKVWEAWKYSHGLITEPFSADVPHGLQQKAAELIASSDHIPKSCPSSQRDPRVQEAINLVDELFETECCAKRARLLHGIGMTFEGILKTSLRRQLVDVLGAHLIGLDDQPAVGYTGRVLTLQEQIAAAGALRHTSSPHAFYYFEKFVEDSGRSYQYRVDGSVKHYRTTAVVRAAVVGSVEKMLDDVERSSRYTNRMDTPKLREYVTDLGHLRRRLAEVNRHLYTNADSPWTLERPLPLPSDVSSYSTSEQRLWGALTALTCEQLAALSRVLAAFAPWQLTAVTHDSEYVQCTQRILNLIIEMAEEHWSEFQRQLTERLGRQPLLLAISRYHDARSSSLKPNKATVRSAVGNRNPVHHFWGRAQEADLATLKSSAECLLTTMEDVNGSQLLSQEHAVERVAKVTQRRLVVPNPHDVYLSDLARAENRKAIAELRHRVEQAGGPAIYYQIANRPEDAPNRLLFEISLVLLAAVAQGSPQTIDTLARTRAKRDLAGYGARGIASLLERWYDLSAGQRVPLQDAQQIHAILLKFGRAEVALPASARPSSPKRL